MNNFWQRLIFGVIFVTVLVGAILLGGLYMHITFGVIVFFGLLEFYKLFEKTETQPQRISGTVIGTALYFCVTAVMYDLIVAGIIGIGLVLLAPIIFSITELFRQKKNPFNNIAVTFTGIIYVAGPFILLNMLPASFMEKHQASPDSFSPILSIFILIWSNDTLAYVCGRLFGKHKLFERISPKKTWEGFIGGVVFSIIAGIILAYFLHDSYVKYIIYALVVSIVGTLGDLVESMLKRSVDVKDSGTMLPGHGGILDRFDAVLFVVPVIFFLEEFIFA